jgi:hypothetical protein
MIFAICGLTVDGTGTERAGTSSVWAAAAPAVPIATHNSIVARSADVTHVWIPPAGCFIAFPLFGVLVVRIATVCARWTLSLQPQLCSIIPDQNSRPRRSTLTRS